MGLFFSKLEQLFMRRTIVLGVLNKPDAFGSVLGLLNYYFHQLTCSIISFLLLPLKWKKNPNNWQVRPRRKSILAMQNLIDASQVIFFILFLFTFWC